jgi:hypothetical protein
VSFITLRHWLTAGSLCHFYNDPAQREQLKPEAQWEVEVGLRLSAMDIYRASVGRSEVYQAADRLFKEYDYLLFAGVSVCCRCSLAPRNRRQKNGHLSPLDGGLLFRDINWLSCDQCARWVQPGRPADGHANHWPESRGS